MYKLSHITSGKETVSQRTVRFDAVWHQPGSSIWDGEGGAIASTTLAVLDTARLATAFAVGETLDATARAALVALEGLVGAGDAVDVREVLLEGDGSNAGKSPRGCWRVETIESFR